jgi:hypothetical protein
MFGRLLRVTGTFLVIAVACVTRVVATVSAKMGVLRRGRPGRLLFAIAVISIAFPLVSSGTASAAPTPAASATWAIYPSPNEGQASFLDSVSCVSATNCTAVGSSLNAASVFQTLVETWDGTAWSITPSPNQGTAVANELTGVSCTSATDCVAVGVAGSPTQTLVETWNGTAWSITPSPNQGTAVANELTGVSCTSSTDCVAVGYAGSPTQTLVETWDGTAWSITPSPDQGTAVANELTGVSCTSSTDCVAVGYAGSTSQTLVETWDGTAWSITPSPNQGTAVTNQLLGVSCASSSDCVAVGTYQSGSITSATLVESWDGSTWSIVPSPNEGGTGNSLEGVSCSDATDCVAVGGAFTLVDTTVELDAPQVETWNGTTWSETPNPNESIFGSGLSGVTCTSSTDCVAVGFYEANSANQTLVDTTGAAPPVITSQTCDLGAAQICTTEITAGQDETLQATASGNPTPTEQWQQSADSGTTWVDIPGATSSSFTITSVPFSDNGDEFRALFTNANGSTNTIPLTLTVLPMVTSSVLLPSNGSTVSGDTWLDASAQSSAGIAAVTFFVEATANSSTLASASAVPTLYGWIGAWDTTDLPNGTYVIQSDATTNVGNTSALSAPVTVTVDNPPLHTEVLIPSTGATLSGSSAVLDAVAAGTSDVTGVQYELSGGSLSNQVIATGTATIYGWLALWNTTTIPNGSYTLQSVATEVGGTTATSPGITMTVSN